MAAEPAVSIIGCCLPVIFYLFQQCYVSGPTSVLGPKFSSRQNKESSGNSSSRNRGWARPTIKQQGYGRQDSDHSLENVTKDAEAATGTYDVDASKGSLQMQPHEEAGLYDGSVTNPQIMVKKDVDVRSNRDNYERGFGNI